MTLLGPPTDMNDEDLLQASVLPRTARVATVPQSNGISGYAQERSRRQQSIISVRHVESSPVAPRVPPNTPLSAQASPSRTVQNDQLKPILAAPLSPTSPKPRLRSFTQQHPRSIPLTKLIQRRLSSVPEEDLGSNGRDRRSPSPPTQRARCYTASGESPARQILNVHLTPPYPLRNSRQPNLVPNSLLLQGNSSAGGRNFLGNDAQLLPTLTTVKLPTHGAVNVNAGDRPGHGTQCQAASGRFNRSKEGPMRAHDNTRGQGARRGWRGKRGRGTHVFNGPERVDGGLMVKS